MYRKGWSYILSALLHFGQKLGNAFGPRAIGGRSVFGHDFLGSIIALVKITGCQAHSDGFDTFLKGGKT